MKKLLSLFLVFSLMLFGCSQSHEEQIRASVDGYLTSLQAGDYTTAMSYCDSDLSDEMGIDILDQQLESIYETYSSLGEGFKTAANDFVVHFLSKIFESYEITSVEEEDGTAKVIVKVSGIDYNSINFEDYSDEVDAMVEEYMKTNDEELTQLYNEGGEDALTEKVATDLASQLFGIYNTHVDEAPTKDYRIRFTLSSEDNEDWKIGKIEIKEDE